VVPSYPFEKILHSIKNLEKKVLLTTPTFHLNLGFGIGAWGLGVWGWGFGFWGFGVVLSNK
jgi:hypothetical protein